MTKEQFKQKIKNLFFIRLHMSLIMVGTMLSGFFISRGLLYLGLEDLAWRYVLGLLVSYLVFIGLVRVWLVYVFGFQKSEADSNLDLDALDLLRIGSFRNLNIKDTYEGGGGSSSGGGASGSWGDSLPSLKDLDFDGDDEGAPIFLIILLIGLILMCLGFGVYLIWEAPTLLAEIALEMAISLGLLQKIRRSEGDWFGVTVKKTIIWFLSFSLVVFITMKYVTYKYPEVKRSADLIKLLNK